MLQGMIHVRASVQNFEADPHVSEKRRILDDVRGQSHRLDVLQSQSAVESTAQPCFGVELQMEGKENWQDNGAISEGKGRSFFNIAVVSPRSLRSALSNPGK